MLGMHQFFASTVLVCKAMSVGSRSIKYQRTTDSFLVNEQLPTNSDVEINPATDGVEAYTLGAALYPIGHKGSWNKRRATDISLVFHNVNNDHPL